MWAVSSSVEHGRALRHADGILRNGAVARTGSPGSIIPSVQMTHCSRRSAGTFIIMGLALFSRQQKCRTVAEPTCFRLQRQQRHGGLLW